MSVKLKIIVVGPSQAGKTLICNAIADILDNNNTKYDPTEGVRILEIELQLTSISENITTDIELWDCSGLSRYQLCWPVMQLDTHGIIFVYNPDVTNHLTELELFYDYFVVQSGLTDSCCFLLANQQTKLPTDISFPIKFDGMLRKTVNILTDVNGVKSYFTEFVETLVSELQTFDQTKPLMSL